MKFLIVILVILTPFIVGHVITHYVAKFIWPRTCSKLDGVASQYINWHVAYRSTDYLTFFPTIVTCVIACFLFFPSFFFVKGILDRNAFLICYVAVGVFTHVFFPILSMRVFLHFMQSISAWWKWVFFLLYFIVGMLPFVDIRAIEKGLLFIPLVSNFLLMILVAVACSTQVSAIYFSEDQVLVCKNWLEPEYFLYEKTELQYSRKEKEIYDRWVIYDKWEYSKYTCVTLKDVEQGKTVATFRLYERFNFAPTLPCNREQVLAALQTLQEV